MNKKIAFTLIELLVVIAIIGILSGLIVVSMSGVTEKANIAKSQVFSNSLRNALMLNLISEWKFDRNDNQVTNDSWSGENNCTLGSTANIDVNDPIWTNTNCVSEGCFYFDGSEERYLNCGNKEVLKSLTRASQDSTWSAWIKTSSPGVIIGKYSPFQFRVTNGKAAAYIYNGTSQIIGSPWTGNADINDNKWHYIVFVVDRDDNFYVYVDGNLDGSPYDISSHFAENWVETATLYVGVRNPGSSMFIGYIDDIRIYNTVVPVSQIKENYYIGLNSLLANGNINNTEYQRRLVNLLASK
jgi:prepilin-type N-terminal cleavage/methylation domain-containing protein